VDGGKRGKHNHKERYPPGWRLERFVYLGLFEDYSE